MKSTLAGILLLLGSWGALESNLCAAVIAGDAQLTPATGPNQLLDLTQSVPPGGGLFGISIAYQSANVFQYSYFGIAEEYALFSATAGLQLTPQYVAQTVPLVSNNGVDPGSALEGFSVLESKYYGYWDDRDFDGNPDDGDNYGWVQLMWLAGDELVLVDSATAIGGGIVVGTLTQIPEPSTFCLTAIAVLGLIRAARRDGDRRCRP